VVIVSEKVKLYRRNNIASGKGAGSDVLIPGLLAFVHQKSKDGKWLLIWGYRPKYFKGWIKKDAGINQDALVIANAAILNKIRTTLQGKKISLKRLKEMREQLGEIKGPLGTPALFLTSEVDRRISQAEEKPAGGGSDEPGGDSGGSDKPEKKEPTEKKEENTPRKKSEPVG